MTSSKREETPEGAARRELLAPFGRAWGKVREAINARLHQQTTEQLYTLVAACKEGQWLHDLSGDDYFIATEVARQALVILRSRGEHGI